MSRKKVTPKEEKKEINEESINKDLEVMKAKIIPNLEEGHLIVVTVGNEDTPAFATDLENVTREMDELFEGTKGVKLVILPHPIKLEAIPLKTLRNIESKVVNSWNDEESNVIDCADGLGIA